MKNVKTSSSTCKEKIGQEVERVPSTGIAATDGADDGSPPYISSSEIWKNLL